MATMGPGLDQRDQGWMGLGFGLGRVAWRSGLGCGQGCRNAMEV